VIAADKLINQSVVHKAFGKGIICNADDKHIEVNFQDQGKVSKFAYPSCFGGFLVLENGVLQSVVDSEVKAWRQESGAVQKEKLLHQYERTLKGIEARRAAEQEKKLKAAQRAMEYRSAYSNMRQEKRKEAPVQN